MWKVLYTRMYIYIYIVSIETGTWYERKIIWTSWICVYSSLLLGLYLLFSSLIQSNACYLLVFLPEYYRPGLVSYANKEFRKVQIFSTVSSLLSCFCSITFIRIWMVCDFCYFLSLRLFNILLFFSFLIIPLESLSFFFVSNHAYFFLSHGGGGVLVV